MNHTAKDRPDIFFATCARLLPADVQIAISSSLPGALTPDDWGLLVEMMRAIKQALPDAGKRQPGEVMQLVTDAIRMASATPIEG